MRNPDCASENAQKAERPSGMSRQPSPRPFGEAYAPLGYADDRHVSHVIGTRGGRDARVSIRKIPPEPCGVPFVFNLRRRGRNGAGIVHTADLCTGQRAARAAFPSGDLPGPEPARNGGRRLFSAAGEAPALHREAK
jgi:hypothetical protein